MTRQHRTPPGVVVVGLAALFAGCSGGAGGGSMSGTAGRAAAGASGGAGSASSGGATGTTGASGTAGSSGTAGTAGASGTAGATGTAGTSAAGGMTGAAGAKGMGGATGTAGVQGTGGAAGATTTSACDATNLVWKTGSKTNFTSYPAPGSAECIQYNGCMYEGEFAGCNQTETLAWVMDHNIVAVFPDFATLKLHDLCLKSSAGKTIVVTVLDECGNSDCNGCCTQNQGSADELIDVESFTDMRWGVSDGRIQWADLGPTKTMGCK